VNPEPNLNTNREARTEKRELYVVLTRTLVTFITALAALYFTYWAGGALLYSLGLSQWISFAASLAAGALTARYVWRRTSSTAPGFVSAVMIGALATGGIGFTAGFFGPILFMPGANQGPLLGIFITGPLGFVAGAVGGAVWWIKRQGRPRRDHTAPVRLP
jgi:hypothetical protein